MSISVRLKPPLRSAAILDLSPWMARREATCEKALIAPCTHINNSKLIIIIGCFHVCPFEQIAEFAPETIMLGSTK